MRPAVCCLMAAFFSPAGVALADENDRAAQMLAAYEKTVGRMTSFRIEAVTKEWDDGIEPKNPDQPDEGFRQEERSTIFHHDFRWRIAHATRRPEPQAGEPRSAPSSGTDYRFDEFLGERQGLVVQWFNRSRDEPATPENLGVSLLGGSKADGKFRHLEWSTVLFGLTPGD